MANNHILVIGGANIEYIHKSKDNIIQGSKNFVEIEELFGGSGVNYSLRLLTYGEVVFPVLFMGDDSTGRQIHDTLLSFSQDANRDFFNDEKFFVPFLTTPRSSIIVEGANRTILSQDPNKENIFQAFVEKRIQDAGEVGALIIGHIHNDRKEINPKGNKLSTIYALEYFSNKDTLVYANFGASQLEYGFNFWKNYLPKVDVLQLNVHELRAFLSNGKSCNLACLIQKVQTLSLTMIITLDQFGALGIMKDKPQTLFMARPISDMDDFVDSTGAGDAFCAGMISKLKGKKLFSVEDFKEAMERGRSWATYACKSYGGANNCPSPKQVVAFHKEKSINNEVVLYHDKAMKDIIALVDSMLEK
jgi:sugar/nucleoside kinase (ribokinase family)